MSLLYSEIRSKLKTGDLLAWRIERIGSFTDFLLLLYQKIFKARFSHVGVVVKYGKRVFLVEATLPVVRIYPISMCDNFYLIKANLKQNRSYNDILVRHVGKKYSLFDFIKGMLNIKGNSTSYYCSELAGEFYREVNLVPDEDASLTPDSIVEAVCKACNTEPVYVTIDKTNLKGIE